MNKINLLNPKVFNRISAGEVVEKPASIVKELVENSIDAGATSITIEIEEGGKKNITVSDNGIGISKEDLPLAFLPHATSKIKEVEDLDSIESLGFRGEALASIASVCQVKMSSKTAESQTGFSIHVDGGEASEVSQVARSQGTTISCSNLFYNTPVREKFLKKTKVEESEITHLVEKFMLSRSEISFKYFVDGKLIYNTMTCSMQDIIYTIYGKEVYDNLLKVDYQEDKYKLVGFITKPSYSRANRTNQTFFVNKRYVENYIVSSAVQSVYESFLMKGRFPFYVLNLVIPADCVDVNVHPSKKEVKFENSNRIFSLVRRAVENTLLADNQVSSFLSSGFSNENVNEENFNNGKNLNKQTSTLQENKIFEKLPFEIPLNETEGKSFVLNPDMVDNFDKEVELKENENLQTQTILNSQVPDFANIKLNEREVPDNRKNNVVFFDQDETKYFSEIKNNVNNFIKASVRDEMKILGTVFKTYIAIEYDENLYFIDQHAAHERLLYDKLLKHVDNQKSVVKQDLLLPYSFKVNAKEYELINSLLKEIENLGFEIEENNLEFSIKTVPAILSNISLDSFVDELLKDGINWDRKKSDFIHNKLCQTACKHAIKAGDIISMDECAYIIEEVKKGVMLCPHGRPITLVISKKDFEKMFKRTI